MPKPKVFDLMTDGSHSLFLMPLFTQQIPPLSLSSPSGDQPIQKLSERDNIAFQHEFVIEAFACAIGTVTYTHLFCDRIASCDNAAVAVSANRPSPRR
jgi:hypothetical protein